MSFYTLTDVYLFILLLIGVWLIYNVVLVSGIQQMNHLYMYI